MLVARYFVNAVCGEGGLLRLPLQKSRTSLAYLNSHDTSDSVPVARVMKNKVWPLLNIGGSLPTDDKIKPYPFKNSRKIRFCMKKHNCLLFLTIGL